MSYNLILGYRTNISYNSLSAVADDLQDVSTVHNDSSPTIVGDMNMSLTDLGPRLSVEIEKPTPPNSVTTNGDALAQTLVDLGLEESVDAAADEIELRPY
jgi:hypothetical protein